MDAIESALVPMVIPFELPAVAAPTVKPVTMTVTALLPLMTGAAVVVTIWVLVGEEAEPVLVVPPLLIVTPGVPVLAKNPDG